MTQNGTNCAGKVADTWASRRTDLEMMLAPKPKFLAINDEMPSHPREHWRLCYGGTTFEDSLFAQDLFDEHEDKIREACQAAFSEYGLCFDYVSAGTFKNQDRGFWRYQISYGGPSEEIRFYADRDGLMTGAEFWYLDWFDGASIDVTDDEIVKLLWNEFNDSGVVDHAYAQEQP